MALASKFNDYFMNKIENIRNNFDIKQVYIHNEIKDTYTGPVMSDFEPVSSEWLRKMMLSKTIKTSPDDDLPIFCSNSNWISCFQRLHY